MFLGQRSTSHPFLSILAATPVSMTPWDEEASAYSSIWRVHPKLLLPKFPSSGEGRGSVAVR